MDNFNEEVLTTMFEVIGMDRSDAQAKIESMTEGAKDALLEALIEVTKKHIHEEYMPKTS